MSYRPYRSRNEHHGQFYSVLPAEKVRDPITGKLGVNALVPIAFVVPCEDGQIVQGVDRYEIDFYAILPRAQRPPVAKYPKHFTHLLAAVTDYRSLRLQGLPIEVQLEGTLELITVASDEELPNDPSGLPLTPPRKPE